MFLRIEDGHFYIPCNDGSKLNIGNRVSLIFQEKYQDGSWRVKIRESLIHCGEDQEAIFQM